MKLFLMVFFSFLFTSCSLPKKNDDSNTDYIDYEDAHSEAKHAYTSYNGLVMTGYQGWFTADGDGAERGWHHYQKNGQFKPDYTSVDLWPDTSEYEKVYKTAFNHKNGSPAYTFSSFDKETVNLHFKWMKDYGIDGAFMQRFVTEIKNPEGKLHFNKVLENALHAANEHGRAISIMYDLSGCTSEDMEILINDWKELQKTFSLFDNNINPTYLRHNQKPLLAIWGVGFDDNRKYSISDVNEMITKLNGGESRNSIMLGVPYYWRTLDNDTEKDSLLHSVIKLSDIIMPWAVGRYNSDSYRSVATKTLIEDIKWCKENNIDYVPLIFPGFGWGNLKNDPSSYNLIPREEGEFFWKQVLGAKLSGVESLYLAMFDEIDEGTALFKCLRNSEVPLNGSGKFIGIEDHLESDYYLWLSGEAREWMKGKNGYSSKKPVRNKSN